MDIFKYNWTDRIKKEPFTNYKLNSDKPRNKREIHYTVKRKRNNDEVSTHKRWLHYNPIALRAINYMPRAPQDENTMLPLAAYRVEERAKVTGRIENPLYDNTRPNSLYNLRYASMR